MSQFSTYLELGFDHISDIQGYDHMLFIITLCAVYNLKDWKRLLVLVTAFTIGHSLTLALSALDIIRIPADLVEVLIPVTILLTSLHNVSATGSSVSHQRRFAIAHYILALVFGLIHGMGFSNFFRALLGMEQSITLPLFAFNIGLELGQLLIVAAFFMLYWILGRVVRIVHREWNLFISGAGAGLAIMMLLERFFG